MDDLGARIAERLAAPAAESIPPPGLIDRIHGTVKTRRRRRQAIAAAAVAAVTLAVPTGLAIGSRTPQPTTTPTTTPTTAPPDQLIAPHPPAELDLLVNRAAAAKIQVRLDDNGYLLRADALGPTGLLLGGTGFDGDPYRASDHRVWLADPRDASATPLTGRVEAWAYAAGGRVFAWLEHRDDQHEYQLICAESGRSPVQISDRGVPKKYIDPVHVDHDIVVWVDEADRAWMVRGCAGNPRQLPVVGQVVAFAYPDAYVIDVRTGELRRVNVETMAHSPVSGVSNTAVYFAASSELVAWVSGGRLTVLDRRTGGRHDITSALPASTGFAGEIIDLTVGHRLVAYSSRPMEGSPTTSVALVYDSLTGREVILGSEAFAAADLLAWRDGPDYVVAPVRPG